NANGYEEVPLQPLNIPWPLGHPRYEEGGFYTAGEFIYWMQTTPLKPQLIAFRGLTDRDGSIGAALGIPNPQPGEFIGSRQPALDVEWASGPLTYTPGFNFILGWRFRSGIALEFSWIHLAETRYSATASLNLGTFPGENLENTFITSPVFN